jgi:transcriptional regulator
MYTPPMFKPDRAASLAFAQARGFGTVCAWDGLRPIASSLPFILSYADDGTPHAAFHVARHNPLLKLADGTSSWLMAVNGADAYVSADWYVSPAQCQVRKLAGAEAALDVVEDDGGTAGCDEESDRGAGDVGGRG